MIDLFKKKPNLYEEQAVLAGIAGTIDELDKYEASEDALGAGLLTILKIMGYSEEQALTASLMTVKALEGEFSKMYWQENSFSHRVAVLVAVIKTAENALKNKSFDKRTMQIVAMALEDVKKNDSDKAANK